MSNEAKPIEDLLFDFLEESQQKCKFSAAIKVHEHAYHNLDVEESSSSDNYLLIGDATANTTGTVENNARLTVEIWCRVTGEDKDKERKAARQRVFKFKNEFIKLLEDNPSMEGRVCLSTVENEFRIFDDTKADKWSVQGILVVFNKRS